jgi:hypothetical protein
MSSVAIIGLSYKAGKKKFFIAWDSLALMAIFALNMAALYLLRWPGLRGRGSAT